MPPIPITIVTGFLGSGKTTLLLNLLPQLRALSPDYKLALLKNEFGDLAVDSQLATSSSISGVRELLNGCICCNLVGQLDVALEELRATIPHLDRIVIETSGSAFPATLAMEVNRLARETHGAFTLDGVITVIDVENWKGYEDTSYTAKIQARYTDLIVFNKWEVAGERRMDECLDRVGDLEVPIAWVKSDKGKVPLDVVLGVDGGLARGLGESKQHAHEHDHSHDEPGGGHQSEVEVLSITLRDPTSSPNPSSAILNTNALTQLLTSAPKDEMYRMKAVLTSPTPLPSSDAQLDTPDETSPSGQYILNWAFGRWTCTPLVERAGGTGGEGLEGKEGSTVLRMTMILARGESGKWMKRLKKGDVVALEGGGEGELSVERLV